MSQPPAIVAKGLRKAYRLYQQPLDAMLEALTRRPRHQERVALDSVDLTLERGEIVGILGRNGAGKSTLLKLIAGVVEPSGGELEVNGRITAILELGTGFHPEYTGRENIVMGGMCLGLSRKEVQEKMQSIIDFSELQDYIDQPFKTYSTGMQARLTFSTAISVDPDIFIVDEALAVGDARFQLKCFSRLEALRKQKTTILLVTHDTNTITMLCDRALILENGVVYDQGAAREMALIYHKLLFGQDKKISAPKPEVPETAEAAEAEPEQKEAAQAPLEFTDGLEDAQGTMRYGSDEGVLTGWGILDADGKPCKVFHSGSRCRMYMRFKCKQEMSDLSFGFAIRDRRGTILWGTTNVTQKLPVCQMAAGEQVSIFADCSLWFSEGEYFITMGVAHLGDGNKIDFVEDGVSFKVVGPGDSFTTAVVNLEARMGVASGVDDRPGQ